MVCLALAFAEVLLVFACEVIFYDFPKVLQNVPRWYFRRAAAFRILPSFASVPYPTLILKFPLKAFQTFLASNFTPRLKLTKFQPFPAIVV